ncbi:MAG TPA: porphobilinogen synthase [Nitrospinota bacterium]|nr:porphobilinogen synthase [Nitrospinota bacterium]
MYFPKYRPRRLRKREELRGMIRETSLSVKDLIYPMFVIHGKGIKREISSMPGIYQMSTEHLLKEVKEIYKLGIRGIILFGIPEKKDAIASEAYNDDGVVQNAIRSIRKDVPDMVVITDVCLCEYTDHGHCGIVQDGVILNDPTLELLAKTALSHAKAGVDIVAPSDMMDGRVAAIRKVLDNNQYQDIPILSYAVKYASGFYGPFREAAESAPKFGNRKSYQMDPANSLEAVREARLDIEEGADIIMVKPALAYLDIICRLKKEFDLPVAAYNVSGEYSMIKAASQKGWLDEERIMIEVLLSIKRAGADMILTYFAKDVAKLLGEKE